MKRDLGKADEIFDIPAIDYFEYGNAYKGGWGVHFRYCIEKVDDNLKAQVWNSDLCLEKAEITATNDAFPASEDGLTACIEWLLTEYEKVENL